MKIPTESIGKEAVEVLDMDRGILGIVLLVDGCEVLIPLRTVEIIQNTHPSEMTTIGGILITLSMAIAIKEIPEGNF